ncbi:MAG: SCO family protein [Myxococcota bacterium]
MRRFGLAPLLGILLVAACATADSHGDGAHGTHHHGSKQAMDLAPGEVAGDSIYQLDSRWTLPEGRAVPLSHLRGRVQVLAMIYTHCEHACPRIIADMRRISRELGPEGDRVGYALVSLDPERDDPARLLAFAEQTGLEGWTLLTSDEGSVRELAAVLGIRYRRISESDFLHSNLLSVLDPDGVVVHRQVGLGADPQAALRVIRNLLGEEDSP